MKYVLLIAFSALLVGCSSSRKLRHMSPCERIEPLEGRLQAYTEARDVATRAMQFDKYDQIAHQERARWEQKMRDTWQELDRSRAECAGSSRQ